MEGKLVSIIIPAYNALHSLKRAVESALGQTEKNIEILVVDDGSSDGTGDLADALAGRDDRMHVWHTKRRGVSEARNTALSHAGGELVTFLDADDALSPGMIKTLEEVMEKEEADIAGCMFGDEKNLGTGSGRTALFLGGKIITEGIFKGDTRVWSKLFKRKLLTGESGKDPAVFPRGISIGEDMLFFLSLIKSNTRYALLDRRLYQYTINPEGAMEKPFEPSYFDQILCWDLAEKMIEENFPEILLSEDNKAELSALQAVSCMLVAAKLARLPRKEREKYSEKTDRIRERTEKLIKVPGMKKYLPRGYSTKITLFLHTPGLYVELMKSR